VCEAYVELFNLAIMNILFELFTAWPFEKSKPIVYAVLIADAGLYTTFTVFANGFWLPVACDVGPAIAAAPTSNPNHVAPAAVSV
jgi:hypothetical protein